MASILYTFSLVMFSVVAFLCVLNEKYTNDGELTWNRKWRVHVVNPGSERPRSIE